MPRRKLSDAERWQAIGMVRTGMMYRRIGEHFNVSQTVILRLVQRWKRTGGVEEAKRSRRPRKTTEREDRLLKRLAKQNTSDTANTLRSKWNTKGRISRSTVNRKLNKEKMRSRRPIKRPLLSQRQRTRRPVLIDDNARPHRARIVKDYLSHESIETMTWPTMSPDMNPIEHLWDYLGRRINQRTPRCEYLQDLKDALIQEWRQFPQNRLRRLVHSMRRRVKELYKSCGGCTHY
ncbi:uncharacterized protein LOC133199913 [Saccostrea echinata]|uniref:uncharacterized protein LOC133199913 n=1 Tax=Saccostrea echinata TaxID=191078 RepID=UPI002A838693|nr:uncharacterized protein LOC133199913 [Saccostrea echinata]